MDPWNFRTGLFIFASVSDLHDAFNIGVEFSATKNWHKIRNPIPFQMNNEPTDLFCSLELENKSATNERGFVTKLMKYDRVGCSEGHTNVEK